MRGLKFKYCSLGWEQLEGSILTKLGSILDQLKEIIGSEWHLSVGQGPMIGHYQSEDLHISVQCIPQTPFW